MAGFEQTIIIGNVGRDPEMRVLPNSGAQVCNFSVAVTTRWTDRQTNERRERTNWYNVDCWNRLAEIAGEYVRKGTQIMVTGTVSSRAYMGQDGQPRAVLDLRADNFQLLGSRDGSNISDPGNPSYENYGSAPNTVDDIPF